MCGGGVRVGGGEGMCVWWWWCEGRGEGRACVCGGGVREEVINQLLKSRHIQLYVLNIHLQPDDRP